MSTVVQQASDRFGDSTRPCAIRCRCRVLAGLLGCAAVFAAWWFWHDNGNVKEIELPRSALIMANGRLCRVSDLARFTGVMLESYPDGAAKSRSRVRDGLLEGLVEGFYPNGQIQVREHFSAGVSHGPRTKWYPTGAKMSEAVVANGQLHGTFSHWQESGELAEQVEMRQGQPNGVAWSYYPSGFVKAWARLTNGSVLEQRFWEDGQQRAQ